MPRIFSESGFEFYIYTDDHPPAHTHVIRGTKKHKGKRTQVIIFLGDEDTKPTIRQSKRMKAHDQIKALSIVCRRQDELLEAWRKYHGS